MELLIVNTKAGWIVQNAKTYVVVCGPYTTREQAALAAAKLKPKTVYN